MINLIIGTELNSEVKSSELMKGKTVFNANDCSKLLVFGKEIIKQRDLLFIKNLDNKMLFKELVEHIELLLRHEVETIAITYRDGIIEAYGDVEGVNIIDLRGE